MRLIQIILIAAAIYYILKIVLRLVLPFALKKLFDKIQNTATPYQPNHKKKEGEVTIQYSKKDHSKGDTQGEYVDFEEIK